MKGSLHSEKVISLMFVHLRNDRISYVFMLNSDLLSALLTEQNVVLRKQTNHENFKDRIKKLSVEMRSYH